MQATHAPSKSDKSRKDIGPNRYFYPKNPITTSSPAESVDRAELSGSFGQICPFKSNYGSNLHSGHAESWRRKTMPRQASQHPSNLHALDLRSAPNLQKSDMQIPCRMLKNDRHSLLSTALVNQFSQSSMRQRKLHWYSPNISAPIRNGTDHHNHHRLQQKSKQISENAKFAHRKHSGQAERQTATRPNPDKMASPIRPVMGDVVCSDCAFELYPRMSHQRVCECPSRVCPNCGRGFSAWGVIEHRRWVGTGRPESNSQTVSRPRGARWYQRSVEPDAEQASFWKSQKNQRKESIKKQSVQAQNIRYQPECHSKFDRNGQ